MGVLQLYNQQQHKSRTYKMLVFVMFLYKMFVFVRLRNMFFSSLSVLLTFKVEEFGQFFFFFYIKLILHKTRKAKIKQVNICFVMVREYTLLS